MACIKDLKCERCGKTKSEDYHAWTGVCDECRAAEADKERRMHLAALTGLTVEERLSLIEAHLYDLPIQLADRFEPKVRRFA